MSAINEILAGSSRYDLNILPDLEAHLEEQLSSGSYNADANFAILKLYLMHPEETNDDVIEKILLKALMAYPATDFSLCLYQIPDKSRLRCKDVVQLAKSLEMAKFKTFWKEAASIEVLSKAQGWQTAVQRFIAGVISATFRSIKSETLCELLNIGSGDLGAFIKEHGWNVSKEDKDAVIVNTAAFESIKIETKSSTTMSLDQYRTLFMAASVGSA